jgi:hypothetical protein
MVFVAQLLSHERVLSELANIAGIVCNIAVGEDNASAAREIAEIVCRI